MSAWAARIAPSPRELRSRLYDEAALKGSLFVLDDKPFGDGLHQLLIVSDLLPHPGYNGVHDIIVELGCAWATRSGMTLVSCAGSQRI